MPSAVSVRRISLPTPDAVLRRDPITSEPIELVVDDTLDDFVVEQLLAVVEAEDFIAKWRGDDAQEEHHGQTTLADR